MDEQPGNENLPEKQVMYSKISPISAAFLGLFGGFFLYQVLGGALHLMIFGMDITSAPANGIRLLTMAVQILFLLLPALIFAKVIYEDVTTIIRFRLPKLQEVIIFSIGIIILTPLLQYFLYIQNFLIVEWARSSPFINSLKTSLDSLNAMVDSAYANLLKVNNIIEGLLVILAVSVVPAITEEVMFRGFIQKSFELKIKPVWAALITAVFFGIFHFNFYGLIPLIALGFYFGFSAYMSNSIVVPMVLHFINNFAAVIVYFIAGNEDLIKSAPVPDTSEIRSSVFMFFIFLVLFIAVIAFIKKNYSKTRTI